MNYQLSTCHPRVPSHLISYSPPWILSSYPPSACKKNDTIIQTLYLIHICIVSMYNSKLSSFFAFSNGRLGAYALKKGIIWCRLNASHKWYRIFAGGINNRNVNLSNSGGVQCKQSLIGRMILMGDLTWAYKIQAYMCGVVWSWFQFVTRTITWRKLGSCLKTVLPSAK